MIALAAISWGTTGATMRLLSPLSPLVVGFIRLAVAGPLLFATAVVSGRWEVGSPANALGVFGVGLAMAAYQVCYFSAVPRTSVAITALLAICTAPLIVVMLARIFLGERLTGLTLAAVPLGITGTAFLVIGPSGGSIRITAAFAFGALLALGAALSYAVVAVLSKHLLATMDPLAIVGIAFPLGAALLSPVALEGSLLPPSTGTQWALLLYLGVLPTALAYVLYVLGLRMTSATTASIVTLLEPLTATTLGILAFGEHLGMLGYIGAVLLLLALVLTIRSPLTPERAGN